MLKSTVAGGSGCVVLFTGYHDVKVLSWMLLLKGGEYLQRVIGAVIVHQHDLQWTIGLQGNALERVTNNGATVIDRYDDGDFHFEGRVSVLSG